MYAPVVEWKSFIVTHAASTVSLPPSPFGTRACVLSSYIGMNNIFIIKLLALISLPFN